MASNGDSQWYWSKRDSGERNGPVDLERLKELAQEGELEPEDFLWREGFDDWKEADSVGDLEHLFASPPPLPEESRQESVEEDGPPSLPQSEKSETDDEHSFPIEFEVEWSGSVWSTESTLRLRRNEVSLHTNDWKNYGGSVGYEYLLVEEIDGGSMTVKGPVGFDKDENVRSHYLEFAHTGEAQQALKVIEYIKGRYESEKVTADDGGRGGKSKATRTEALSCIHNYNENEVCRKCGWSRNDLKSLDKSLEREERSSETADTSEEDEGASWYWSKRGSDERNGPVDLERLEEVAEEGDLEPEDLVWTKGMDDWEEAGSVERLDDLFASPPPLPEESEEEGDTQEEAPPSLPQSEKSETDGDNSFSNEEIESKIGKTVNNEKEIIIGKILGMVTEYVKDRHESEKTTANDGGIGGKSKSTKSDIDYPIYSLSALWGLLFFSLKMFVGILLQILSFGTYEHNDTHVNTITYLWIGMMGLIGLFHFVDYLHTTEREKAAEVCEERVREEYGDATLFGSQRPDIGGVADESTSYPGRIIEIEDGEYYVKGFAGTEHITSEQFTGDMYQGTSFICTVKSVNGDMKVTEF